jgi:hypothetical protein
MNAIDFLHTSDRDYNQGICMWTANMEWCALALTVENYRGSFKQPMRYGYGHLYGIHVPDGLPEHDSLWICDNHRLEFLKLNSGGNVGTTIWQMDHNGMGKDVTWVPMKEVSVRIRTHMDEMDLSNMVAEGLDELAARHNDITSWDYLKVVST